MLGLETALSLALTELDVPIEKLLALMSWQPAAIAGIDDTQGGPIAPGAPANLCVIDPETRWTVSGETMASHSNNTPFEGRKMRGRVRHTIALRRGGSDGRRSSTMTSAVTSPNPAPPTSGPGETPSPSPVVTSGEPNPSPAIVPREPKQPTPALLVLSDGETFAGRSSRSAGLR